MLCNVYTSHTSEFGGSTPVSSLQEPRRYHMHSSEVSVVTCRHARAAEKPRESGSGVTSAGAAFPPQSPRFLFRLIHTDILAITLQAFIRCSRLRQLERSGELRRRSRSRRRDSAEAEGQSPRSERHTIRPSLGCLRSILGAVSRLTRKCLLTMRTRGRSRERYQSQLWRTKYQQEARAEQAGCRRFLAARATSAAMSGTMRRCARAASGCATTASSLVRERQWLRVCAGCADRCFACRA